MHAAVLHAHGATPV